MRKLFFPISELVFPVFYIVVTNHDVFVFCLMLRLTLRVSARYIPFPVPDYGYMCHKSQLDSLMLCYLVLLLRNLSDANLLFVR